MDLLALALIVFAVVAVRRHLTRGSGPEAGPASRPSGGPGRVDAAQAYRHAYEARRADATRGGHSPQRYRGGFTARRGFTTTTGVLGAILAFPALVVAVLCGGFIFLAVVVGTLSRMG